MREGRLEEAVDEYRRAMIEDPLNGYLHLSLGAVYEQMGRLDDAIAEYERAVAMYDMDGDLRMRLALAYLEAGHDEDAAATLREAGELMPWDAQLQFSLAQLFTSLGLEEDAELALQRLTEIQQAMLPDFSEDDVPPGMPIPMRRPRTRRPAPRNNPTDTGRRRGQPRGSVSPMTVQTQGGILGDSA